ncbi:unnamed protein product [Rhizophagus irregularis]|nr:unnamed protein product [Rhizophagus irregularis]
MSAFALSIYSQHRDDILLEASRAIKPTYLIITLQKMRVHLIVDFDDVNNGSIFLYTFGRNYVNMITSRKSDQWIHLKL